MRFKLIMLTKLAFLLSLLLYLPAAHAQDFRNNNLVQDPGLAYNIRKKLVKSPDSPITMHDLEKLSVLEIFPGSPNIRSLEGLQYAKELWAVKIEDCSQIPVAEFQQLKSLTRLNTIKLKNLPQGTDLSFLSGKMKLERLELASRHRDRIVLDLGLVAGYEKLAYLLLSGIKVKSPTMPLQGKFYAIHLLNSRESDLYFLSGIQSYPGVMDELRLSHVRSVEGFALSNKISRINTLSISYLPLRNLDFILPGTCIFHLSVTHAQVSDVSALAKTECLHDVDFSHNRLNTLAHVEKWGTVVNRFILNNNQMRDLAPLYTLVKKSPTSYDIDLSNNGINMKEGTENEGYIRYFIRKSNKREQAIRQLKSGNLTE